MTARLIPLLVLFTLVATGSAVAQLAIVQQWPIDQFPGGIAYDIDRDHIWLVNDSTNEIREYDRFGSFIMMFPGSQVNANWPCGLDYEEASQHLWIADEYNPEMVIECTRDGVFVSSFSVDADMQDAVGIAYVASRDQLYVTDDTAGSNEVVMWTKTGTLIGRWPTSPNTDTDAIAYLDATNTVLVGDDNAAMVYEFTLDGVLLNTYDMTALLGIQGVEGLSYDPATGNVFLGDSTTGAARIIYEISGFVPPVPVQETTWGGVKAIFR